MTELLILDFVIKLIKVCIVIAMVLMSFIAGFFIGRTEGRSGK
jgi:UPF0716 family protein affecting phage T7 exclusion